MCRSIVLMLHNPAISFLFNGHVITQHARTLRMSCGSEPSFQVASTTLTRRMFNCLVCSTTLTVFADIHLPENVVCSSEPQAKKIYASQIADRLRYRCQPFLDSIRPVSQLELLWRGHPDHVKVMTESNPPSDLLNIETYGKNGAKFFKSLDLILTSQSIFNSQVPRPSESHIGTGSFSTAEQWGIPHTVWPCGDFRYAFWKNGDLIYTSGDTIKTSYQQRGPMLFGEHLREALHDGREVMFQCHSFYILPSHVLMDVLEILRSS